MDFAKTVSEVPQLARGRVWCRSCGSTRRVDSRGAMSNGWPKCCQMTMTIDSPEEQAAFAARGK
jgi:hypothetical protein